MTSKNQVDGNQVGEKDANGNPKNPNKTISGNTPTVGAVSMQIAAAVELNITNHVADAVMSGVIKAKNLTILADNNGNFYDTWNRSSHNTGFLTAMLSEPASPSQLTKAHAWLDGSYDSEETGVGDVIIKAELTQNMDVDKRRFWALSNCGAASEMVPKLLYQEQLLSNQKLQQYLKRQGIHHAGDITVDASDKSKLAVRAGAVSYSRSSSGSRFLICTYFRC